MSFEKFISDNDIYIPEIEQLKEKYRVLDIRNAGLHKKILHHGVDGYRNFHIFYKIDDIDKENSFFIALRELISEELDSVFEVKYKKKSSLLNAFTLIFYNIYSVIYDILDDESTYRIWHKDSENECYIERCIELGYAFVLNADKNAPKRHLGTETICQDTFMKAVQMLEEEKIVYRRQGHLFKTEYRSFWTYGFLIPAWNFWWNFFRNTHVRFCEILMEKKFDRLEETTPDEKFLSGYRYCMISEKNSVGKYTEFCPPDDSIRKEDIRLMKFSEKIIRKYNSSLDDMDIHIQNFDDASSNIQGKVILEFEKKDIAISDSLLLNFQRDIVKFNTVLRNNKGCYHVYRILHAYKDRPNLKKYHFNYGRLKGICTDYMPRTVKQLLMINNENTVEIDLKSAVPMLGMLIADPSYDPQDNPDLYRVDVQDDEGNLICRDNIKQAVSMSCNCKDPSRAFKAYLNATEGKGQIKTLKKFIEVMNQLKAKYPGYADLLYHEKNQMILMTESDFMLKCLDRLIKQNLNLIYNFDAFIAPESIAKKVKGIMIEVSKKMFDGRIVNIDIS